VFVRLRVSRITQKLREIGRLWTSPEKSLLRFGRLGFGLGIKVRAQCKEILWFNCHSLRLKLSA